MASIKDGFDQDRTEEGQHSQSPPDPATPSGSITSRGRRTPEPRGGRGPVGTWRAPACAAIGCVPADAPPAFVHSLTGMDRRFNQRRLIQRRIINPDGLFLISLSP